jgi:hypothetical protein
MACLTQTQTDIIFKHVGSYFKSLKDPKDYNHLDHFKYLYNLGINKGVKPETSLNYVQVLPNLVNKYLTITNTRVSKDEAIKLTNLAYDFEEFSLEQIAEYIGQIKQPDVVSTEEEPIIKEEEIEANESLPLYTALSSLVLSTTLNEKLDINELEKDLDKVWHHEFNRELLSRTVSATEGAFNTTLNGHRGFRLKAVKMSSIPFDELYNSIKGDKSEEEVKAILDKNNAIALVVTDNDGNLLRFDQTYTKDPNGKLVYFNMRDTKYDLLDSTDARGRIQSISDIARNYKINEKDAEEQIKKEVEKLRNIQKAVFEDKPVLFEITGGTKGYIPSIVRPKDTKNWYGIAPSTYGDIVDSFGITPIEIITEGEFKGRLMIYLNEGKLPVLLLNRNITDAEALEYASAVHKFLNENNYSSGAVNTAATFLSQYIAFSQPEKVSLEQFLFNKLNTPEGIAQMIVKKPNSNFNRFLTYQANQSIYYTIADGSIKQATLNEYQNQWRDKLKTLLVKSQNGKIEQFSSSLSFEPTSESRNIVNGVEEVKEEKKNTAIIFGGISRNLEDFLKERNITSTATKKQIEEAFEWYKSSPLSKVIPFTTMFDIVNSTAKASFGKEGIKLFFGANYTDLYHEAWHGFSQLFLSKNDKVNLYEELKKLSGSFVLPNGVRVNYKDASYRQLEEVLAEDFRLYKLSGGKKVLGQRPIRNKFFRAILDFLNWLFDGVSFNQARNDFNSIKKVHDLFKRLDIGDIKEYKASDKNSLFTSLASPIGISTDTPLNETESTEVSESIDSIISDLMFQFAEQNGVSIFGDFLGSKKSIKNIYRLIKETLEKKVDELNEDVEANDRAIFIINTALNNFGNIDEIIDSGNIEGDTTIQYHLRRSKVLDFKNKEFDDEGKEDSSDFVTKKDQADQGELSFEELANEKVLFLIRTLKAYKLENGRYVPEKNNLGFSKLTNYRKTLGNVINIVSNNTGAISIYNKLNEARNKPEIQELLMKLGKIEPNTDIDSKSTFNSWVLFANSFNTTKLPMLITIIETAEDTKPKIYNVDASSDISSERSRMISRFKTNIYNTKFATMNSDKNEMMLDIRKLSDMFEPIFGETAKRTEANKQEAAFYLFAAIGLPLDDKLYEQYFDKDKNLSRDIVKNATYVYRELKDFYDRNTDGKLKNNMIPDHIDLLTNGLNADSDFLTQKTVIDNLLYLHIKVADVVSSFSLLNAEGNREYENVLNSQITITQNNINESRTLEELYNKPGFEHFNPANNPMINVSQVFKRLFANGVRQTDFNIRKFSGIQSIEDGYFTNGQSTIETDPVSKFYLEFYSYLTTGFTSNPTPSDKKTYLGFFVTAADGDNRFIKPNAFVDGSALGDKALEDIIFDYLKAEHERVYDLNSNTYPELARLGFFSNYGKEFLVFDNILLPETKQRLKTLSPKELLEDANQELVSRAKNEIIEYVNKLTDQNYEVFQKIDFIDDEVLRKATKQKGKFNSTAYSKNIVKAFTANTFIQYIESTIMFYGDVAAYDLIKEDFHKRDSASGSTGRTMITDPQFIKAYNRFYGSQYAKSQGFNNSFNENGYINTAIFQDHKYENKALMDEYENSWRKAYTEEFKKLGFSAKQIKEKVDFLIEKQLTPYKQDEVKEGDAQGWVTLDSYRFFSILLNEWSPAHEDIYNKIVNNESVDQAEVLKVFSPKKFQFYGPLKTSKYHVNVLHKFSLLPLIPNVIQGKNIDILHRRMIRENVQYATFISGSKIATLRNENNELDKFYSDPSTRMMDNSPLTKNVIHLRYLRNQVPINDYYKNRVVFSTQLRALIYNDLFNKGIPLSKNIETLVNKYIQSIEDYVEASKDELKQEINFNSTDGTYDVKKLAKIIKRELDRRDIPDHLQIAATSVNENGFTYDMSLARNANDIEKILFSIANKRIVRRKINGEPLIQVAGSGFESQRATNPTKEQVEEYKGDDLLFYRKDPITGENLPMQVKVALQGKFKNLLGLTHPDGKKINTRERLNQALKNKEWRDKHKEMLQLMAVRIPVQGHNSMEYMEVAEFLPEVAGPIVILPSYIVAKAGSDYDIDKLSVFFPNISGKQIYNLNKENLKSIIDNAALNEAFSKSKLSKKDTVKLIVDVLTNKEKVYKLTAEDKLIADEIEKFKEISDVKLSEDKLESLENNLIRNLINIISTDEVFEMMKKPNGTYLVQDFANDMTKYFETDYNPKESFKDWNRSTVSSISPKFKVSPTNIFEIQYNIYKQNANSVGKRALGIGANVNKIKALFNQIDFEFNKEYIHTRYNKKKKKYEEQLRQIRILLNHNSGKNGSISLSSLYNTEGIKISDYLNQLMNGWLDVAKDPWIFYVMGTPELTPALLYLVSAGTPFEEAVYFLAQPVVRKYIEDVKKLNSPISKLDETFKDPFEFSIQARMLGLGREANGHTLWERQMSLINLELQRTENQIFTKDYLQSKLDDSLTGPLEYSREDQAILAHFFEINDGAKAIARVQQSFNFDTKTSSTLFETFKRGQKRDILIEDVEFEVNYSKMFPKEKLKSLYEDTILGKFDITDVQTNVFGGLFPIRNNPQLNEYLYNIYSNNIFFGSQFDDKIKKFLGDPEKFVSEFKNDFTTAMLLKMLYDFKIEDNQYKGLEIQTITRDVDIRDLGLLEEPESEPSTESTGFQGYKGGFEDEGKGTPEGDGKDKAMRQVADGAIVEFKTDKVDSSSFTTLNYFDGTYSYEKDRYIGEAFIGDSFKGFSNKIIMLARNGKFAGTSLNNETKKSIKRAFDRGVEFVVGDMPGVDSQFIDYLQEIGAKFTIYHTGKTPRIQVTQTTTQPITQIAKQEKGKGEPKFIATGVFIKDDKIYLDINTLNNIYNQLNDNSDTIRDVNGVSIKYPPKKAFRSFTEFVNYSLEKEYLRNVLSNEDIKTIALRLNNLKVDISSKLNNSPIKVVNEFNLSDNKKLFEIYKMGGIVVDAPFGLKNLIDTTTGEIVLENITIQRNMKVTQYEIDESKLVADAIESYLMDKALKNINNIYSYTQHIGLDYPTQLSELIKTVPSLRSQYLLPNLFTTRKIKNSRSKQLVLNQADLDPGMISILHEQYLQLSDPGVMKVEDAALNQYISDVFKQLSTYALLTEGFSKQGTFSLSEVVGQEDLLEIGTFNNINEYVNGSLSKTLDSNGKAKYENFLNSFAYKFFKNRLGLSLNEKDEWSFNRSYLNNNKDYLIEDYQIKPLVPENIENFKYLSKFSDNYYIINVNSVINDSKTSSDKKFKSSTLTEYANMFSDVTFIYDTDIMKNLGLKALSADNIKVVNSPEALMKLNISGPIALPSNGLNPAFNEVLANKFGILNLGQRDISKNATLTDIINSDSLLVTSDIVNLIRSKAIAVLDELKNSCNL